MLTPPQMFKSLLAVAKANKLQPVQLAKGAGLDLSSSNRVLTGKAVRPSFAMVCGLAKMTGYKIELVRDPHFVKSTENTIGTLSLGAKRAKSRKTPKKSKRNPRRGRKG